MERMKRESIERIERVAERLRRKYRTSDPYELAECMDCIVDLEEYPSLLGFCNVILGVRVIGLNSNSDYYTRRCACAHELGHLALGHVKRAGFQFGHASDIANMHSQLEAEANCFAASLLMSDEDTLEAIRAHDDAEVVAASMFVCPELLQAKVRILNAKGHDLRVPDLPPGGEWRHYVSQNCLW